MKKNNPVKKAASVAVGGGVYPKFIQSPRALVGQEYGRSGLQYFMPGWIKRDYLPELQGRQLWLVYEQMGSNDAYVGSALNAYSLFIRRANWHVDPGSDENKENGSADFLQSCMDDMQHTWQTIIATAAKPTLQFGFAPFEKIFKERNGEQDDDRYSSEYEDGAIGWQNFAFRGPDSILHWDYDPREVTRLLGFTQLAAPDWRTTFIPIEKIVNLRAEPGKDSPEGRSILRPVWRSWRTKTIMEDLRNVIAERGGAGIPWAEVPANIANAPQFIAVDPENQAAIEAMASYQSLVDTMENITTDAQKWIITPQVWDTKGQPQIKVGFLQPSQNADIIGHITASIEAEAKAILIATMTEFQALGMGGTGSLALSRDKTDNFTLAVAATLTSFQESVNQQAVRQLFRLNPQFEFERGQPKPRIVYDPLVPLSTQDVVAMLGLFEKAGWDLSKQAGIRDAIVKNLGLPEFIEQETEEALQEHGDAPIESLLDGKSALDAIMGTA
jgi:predicted RNA-binding protein with PIN domain